MTKQLTIQPLIEYFKKYLPLDATEEALLETRVTHRKIKRRQMILQEGFICKHYFFVVEGCFRMYSVDHKGAEHNVRFAAENDWISDLGSFYTEKASRLFIEAMEPSIILQLEKKTFYFYTLTYRKLTIILG